MENTNEAMEQGSVFAPAERTLTEKLRAVQVELKAPKNMNNSFGKYRYRNLEGILEAVKPLLGKHELTLTITDDIAMVGPRFYIKVTATITDGKDSISTTAFAREPETKKGMDEPQVTGAASSYARKYCLNGLFLIDDTKDPDTDEYARETDKQEPQQAPQQAPTMLDNVKQVMRQAGIREDFICKSYNIPSLDALTINQQVGILRNPDKFRAWQEGQVNGSKGEA